MKTDQIIKKGFAALFVAASLFGAFSCKQGQATREEGLPWIVSKALDDNSSVYYADYAGYPSNRRELPVGMFDSGTGGLTVLEQFLAMDMFDNKTGEQKSDGIPDFGAEDFIYLADQANMPYGVYSSQQKEDYLKELIIKDALFLTTEPNRTKIVVIACNTATAYGLDDVKALLEYSGTGIRTIGVINAGVEGVFESINTAEKSFAIGVLATVGTISSKGYQNSIVSHAAANGYDGDLRVVAQGGLGFAEAVDSEPDYISVSATSVRDNYRGPKWGDSLGIKPDLLPMYNFDQSGLLIKTGTNGEILDMQLNSAGNYARFHMVTMMQKHRESNPGIRMKGVILGCTHYPYLLDTLVKVTEELRQYEVQGTKVFAGLIDDNLKFVDPAVNTAKETYLALKEADLLKRSNDKGKLNAFISVPSKELPDSVTDGAGNLLFNFKYGRDTGSEKSAVTVVPFSKENINRENLTRIMVRLPLSYSLIEKNLN